MRGALAPIEGVARALWKTTDLTAADFYFERAGSGVASGAD
jgi:hypothetical protein